MKKLYMLAAGALCAAMASAANGDVTDGWLMLEDFEGTAPEMSAFSTNDGKLKDTGTIEIKALAKDGNDANKALYFTPAGNYSDGIQIKATLPAGKTIADYTDIKLDIYGINTNYKPLNVYINGTKIYEQNNAIGGSQNQWIEHSHEISVTGSGNVVTIGFYNHTNNNTTIVFDNIRLKEKEGGSGEDPDPVEPDATTNGTVTDGWLMVEDYQTAKPGDAVMLSSQSGEEGVNGEAKIEVDPANSKNLVATYTATKADGKNYNTLFAINVTLPEGKTLKNYEKIAFKIYRFESGDDDYKQMLVKADSEEIYKDTKENGDDNYIHQADTKTWTVKEYEIANTVKAGNSFKLIFGIKTENAHYAVDEIRLLERTAEPEIELDGDPEISISHDTAAGEMIVSYNFNVTNYGGEEVTVVANIDGHEEVIFEEYVPEAENAPMRAAAENRTFSGSLKATHEVLKALANPDVKVSATADDKELFAVTKAPDSTTGITGITADSETKAEYFNLQGIRIANPEPGQLYIRRQGSKAVKIRF